MAKTLSELLAEEDDNALRREQADPTPSRPMSPVPATGPAATDPERFVTPELQAQRDTQRVRLLREEQANPDYSEADRAAVGRELARAQGQKVATPARPAAPAPEPERPTKRWSEVVTTPEFKALGREEREAAREQYWREVVGPKVPAEERKAAREQFDKDTEPTLMGRAAEELGRLGADFKRGAKNMLAASNLAGAALGAEDLNTARQQVQWFEENGATDSKEYAYWKQRLETMTRAVGGQLAVGATRSADAKAYAEKNPPRAAVTAASNAKTFGEAFEAIKADPYNVIAGVTAESAPAMVPALVAGIVNPVLGVATMGASSGATEFGSSLTEFVSSRGVDPRDPQAVQQLLSDPQALQEALSFAGKRAGIIAAADTLTAGIASKTLAPKAVTSQLGKQAVNLPTQMAVQAAGGAGGEAAAQVATTGSVSEPGQVLLEAAGELGGAPAEVAALGHEARKTRSQSLREAAAKLRDVAAEKPAEQPAEQPAAEPPAPGAPPQLPAPPQSVPQGEPGEPAIPGNFEVVDDTLPQLGGQPAAPQLPAPTAPDQPTIAVDSQGNAAPMPAGAQAELDAQRTASEQRAADLGLTPDVLRAQAMRKLSAPSTAPAPAHGTDPKRVDHFVEAMRRRFVGFDNLDIKIAKDASGLPEGSQDANYEGVYDPVNGTVTLNAAGLAPGRVAQVVAHEIIGHHGVESTIARLADSKARSTFESEWTKLLDDTIRVASATGQGHAEVDEANYASIEAVKADMPGIDDRAAAREVLARMAETGQWMGTRRQADGSYKRSGGAALMDRLTALLQRLLRHLGVNRPYTKAELRKVVTDSLESVRAGTNRRLTPSELQQLQRVSTGRVQSEQGVSNERRDPQAAGGDQAAARGVPDRGRVQGSAQRVDEPGRAAARPYPDRTQTLAGLPDKVVVDGEERTFGAFAPAHEAAREYMRKAGLPYHPPKAYAKVSPERAQRIASAFAAMKHDPQDPDVKRAYAALVKETLAQWEAVKATGLQVEFIDLAQGDPYGNPRNAIRDVVENNHLWVFATDDGFGSSDTIDPADNPLFAPVEGETISGRTPRVNDLFRIVHDYFGHIKDGVGFRADGEENAWQSHAAMYSPLARRALTTETRGQNSWVNYGPHGIENKTASPGDTVYADQKIGLLPAWVSTEGYLGGATARATKQAARSDARAATGPAALSKRQQAPQSVIDPFEGKSYSSGPFDWLAKNLGGKLVGTYITSPLYNRVVRTAGSVIPEKVKHGLVSDYGLPEPYTDAKVDKGAAVNKAQRKAKKVLDKLADLDREQSRIAYLWMNEKPDTATEQRLLAQLPEASRATMREMKQLVDELGRDAVKVGLLDKDSYERNRMAYLHRSYAKHDANGDSTAMRMKKNAALRADTYKGRGLFDDVKLDALVQNADEVQLGDQMHRMEKRAADGRLLKVAYLPGNQPIPREFTGWRADGLWTVRSLDRPGNKGQMWRDFSQQEREAMGEIDEVRYAFAKTVVHSIRDIENARFLQWVADTYAKPAYELQDDQLQPASESFMALKTYKTGDYVKVPDTTIAKTGGIKKYGALAGKAVPGFMWNDIRNAMVVPETEVGKALNQMMRAWKISKTALSPATHTNNVMSNFVMADMADVGAHDVLGALHLIIKAKRGDAAAQAMIERYEDSGADHGNFAHVELTEKWIEPVIQELLAQQGNDLYQSLSAANIVALAFSGQLKTAAKAAAHKGRAAAVPFRAMIAAYRAEDTVFRLAKFIKETKAGHDDKHAGKAARDAFLNYDINAPWINAARRGPLPFLAFSYRAIPLMMRTAAEKPWKAAKYAAVFGALNALAYWNLGGDGDEDKEKRLLPEELQGKMFGLFPRLLRMPWNDSHDSPVFLDMRRWVPGGDIFDVSGSKGALPLPPWLSIGGPLSYVAELATNTSSFTGQKIVKATDTVAEKAAKVADHLFKFMAPNLPLPGPGNLVPGTERGQLQTYSWQGILDAGKGRTDAFGREGDLGTAALSAVGVKAKSYPADAATRNIAGKMAADEREVRDNMAQLQREFARKGIDRAEFNEKMAREVDKLKKIAREAREKLAPAR